MLREMLCKYFPKFTKQLLELCVHERLGYGEKVCKSYYLIHRLQSSFKLSGEYKLINVLPIYFLIMD